MSKFPDWLKARPIAHRGLHDVSRRVVENTRTAFALAIESNYAIECDLQISGDGEAMVFHDPELDRLTVETGHVNARTAEQLKQVCSKDCDDKMQSLAELLSQVDGKVPLIIELKSLVDGDMTLADRAIDVLADYKGDFCLMSFGPLLMREVKRRAPEIIRGAVVSPETEELWLHAPLRESPATTMLDMVEPDFLSYDVKGLPSEFVSTFKIDEKPVICWTIKDQKTADFAYQFCDQITFEGFRAK